MTIIVSILVGLLFGIFACLVWFVVVLNRPERPEYCRNCSDNTLEYIGFVATQADAETGDHFVPSLYYQCDQCKLTSVLERGEWSDVASSEVPELATNVAGKA